MWVFMAIQVIETPRLIGLPLRVRNSIVLHHTDLLADPCGPHDGRDPIRLGVAYSTIMPWHNNGIHPEETFLPSCFSVPAIRQRWWKWHLGHAQQSYHPNARGFEHFYGHLHTEVGFYPPFASLGGKDFQRNGYRLMTRAMKVSYWRTKLVATSWSEIKHAPFSSTCRSLRHTRHSTRQKTCRRSTLTCPMSAASHVAKWPTTHALWRK